MKRGRPQGWGSERESIVERRDGTARPWRNADGDNTDSGAAREALIARHAGQRQLSLYAQQGNKLDVLHTLPFLLHDRLRG